MLKEQMYSPKTNKGNPSVELAPIALFVYNRLDHTRATIEALQKNKLANQSELYIFSDAAKTEKAAEAVGEVRAYIKTIGRFKSIQVIEREKNLGLANSIIDGVTQVIEQHGKIVVLEDDLVTSPFFLKFMNDTLDFYESDKRIMSITGFNYPSGIFRMPSHYQEDIYLNYRCHSWSWGTWKERWHKVDWSMKDFDRFKQDKEAVRKFNRGGEDLFFLLDMQNSRKIDSWAIRFCYAHFKNSMYTVYPNVSYVDNIGHDDSGTHCRRSDKYTNSVSKAKENVKLIENIQIDQEVTERFKRIFPGRVVLMIKKLLKKIID